MADARGSLFSRAMRKVRAQFIVGILIGVPVAATILILVWVFNAIDNILRPVFHYFVGRNIPGTGFVATVILIYILGVIGSSLIGRRWIKFWESLLRRVPVVRTVYTIAKQITEGFSGDQSTGFRQVVLIEYPRQDIKSIAFVTSEFTDAAGKKWYNVFIPTSPNPTSGFLRIMAADEITKTSLSVDEAIKMLVSFGRTTPDNAGDKLGEAAGPRVGEP